jgi:hypothetical protein
MHRLITIWLAGLALLGATAAAQAQDITAGEYKLTVGAAAPCSLTLAADGGASLSTDCQPLKAATGWHKSGALYKLAGADGTTIALLKPTHDGGFVGTTVPGGQEFVATH